MAKFVVVCINPEAQAHGYRGGQNGATAKGLEQVFDGGASLESARDKAKDLSERMPFSVFVPAQAL